METMWYYVKNGTDRHGPVPESELKSLAGSGQVLPSDLVWKEGMAEWTPYASAPGLASAVQSGVSAAPTSAPSGGGSGLSLAGKTYQTSSPTTSATPDNPAYASAMPAATGSVASTGGGYAPPEGLTGWLQFVGVMNILGGVLTCLAGIVSIITIIGPILYLPLGILMIMAGNACTGARQAVFQMQQIDAPTELFMSKIKRYMVMYGIVYILSIVLTVLIVIGVIVALATGMNLEDFSQ